MITYGTDLNDISVTGTYRVSDQMKADNNPRHYLIIPGIVVQQILDAERKKKESDANKGDETALNRYAKEVNAMPNEEIRTAKYKPGDFIAVRFKMFTDKDEGDRFEYRHYIILYVDSSFYKLLRLENVSDNANTLFITTYEIPIIDDNESKLLYHFDADKIREMCQDDAGFEDS